MTKALEIRIRKINHSKIGVTITHQCDHRIKRNGRTVGTFNEITFSSVEFPEISGNTLYLKGRVISKDDYECIVAFSDSKACTEYVTKLSSAIDELNQKLGG